MNLFVGGSAKLAPNGHAVGLRQDTRYPWDGQITLAVDPDQPRSFVINVRVPGWTGDEVMPGGLYKFIDRGASP